MKVIILTNKANAMSSETENAWQEKANATRFEMSICSYYYKD